jgi:hypothetical protein
MLQVIQGSQDPAKHLSPARFPRVGTGWPRFSEMPELYLVILAGGFVAGALMGMFLESL